MNTTNICIGHTFHGESGEISGILKNNLYEDRNNKLYTVELNILGGHEFLEFLDLNSTIEYSKSHNLVYRFIESSDKDKSYKIYVIHNITCSDKIVAYSNFYGIGGDWKLYLNGKSDIVVQHVEFPKTDITIRFRDFPLGKDFYVYLSCLIFTLTNYKIKEESELIKIFSLIKDYATK